MALLVDARGCDGWKRAAYAAATVTAALFKRSCFSLSYAPLACIESEWRMLRAAARSVSSS